MPVWSANVSVSRSSAGTSPKSSSTFGRSSTARRRTSCSAATTSSRSSASAACAGPSASASSSGFSPSRIEVSAWPVSSWSSRASRRRSSSCAATTRRSASRATRSERSTATAARAANVSARRRSSSEKRAVGRAELVVRLDHADHALPRGERHPEPRPRAEPARQLLVDLRVVDHGVDALAAAALEHDGRSSTSSGGSVWPTSSSAPSPAAAATRSSSLAGRQQDDDEPRVEQLAQPPRDEVEQRLELGLGRERVPDLVQRLELARPARRRLVQPRVLDRHRGLPREQHERAPRPPR